MSPTKRTKRTNQAGPQNAQRPRPVVPEVISAPSVTKVPAVVNAPSLSAAQKTGGDATTLSEQSTAPIPPVPGSSIVEQARIAGENTEPLPKIEAGAAVAAAVAAHEAAVPHADAGGQRRPSVKAKVEKQRAREQASQAHEAAPGKAGEAGAEQAKNGAGQPGADATAPESAPAGAATSSASSKTANAPSPSPRSSTEASRTSVDRQTPARETEGGSEDAVGIRQRIRGLFKRPDGAWRLWLKITVAVVAVLLVLAALTASMFAWNEWGRGDDAYDIQGSWTMDDGPTPITISADKITLSKDAAYSYALDTGDKTITYSFVNRLGGGHYRFSLDRSQIAIIEGSSADGLELVWSDFTWCVHAWISQLFYGQALSPAPVAQEADARGEEVAVTVLTKVAGTSADTANTQDASTPSIVIERTGGLSSAGSTDDASGGSAEGDGAEGDTESAPSASAMPSASPAASSAASAQ